MNYKELFRIILLLISSPARAWEEIRLESDKQKVFSTFVYPMIGLCSLSVFVKSLWDTGWGTPASFQTAMIKCCAVAVSLFGGYFLSAFLINQLGVKQYELENDMPLMQQLGGYALVVTFLIQIVIGLFPKIYIIGWILQFYIIYIVWEGVPILTQVKENNRLTFTFITSTLLVACPIFIRTVFDLLITYY